MSLTLGQKAPTFSLQSSTNKTITLSNFLGKKIIVLYFYPKDNTPGCTREACAFQAGLGEFAKLEAVVLGVSKDTLTAHEKFASQYNLTFPLLSDPDKVVHKAYGAWGKKVMYGKEVEGTIRTTVIIGKDGLVKKIWKNVKVDGHDAQVLEVVKKMT